MKSMMMMPPMLRRRNWIALSSAVEVDVGGRLFKGHAHILAAVDVDRHECFGLVDHEVANDFSQTVRPSELWISDSTP